jgi:aminoglycoside 2'-N-acetyltransferase I
MRTELRLETIHAYQLTTEQLTAIHMLCNRAYEEDLTMWVTRWLQAGDGPYLRTAYVEMVATEPSFQRFGFATEVMRRLANEISGFDLGGLCPAEPELYAKLGWVLWRGPLLIRTLEGVIPTPDERVMILKLPNTPPLDFDLPLSAEWREGELW